MFPDGTQPAAAHDLEGSIHILFLHLLLMEEENNYSGLPELSVRAWGGLSLLKGNTDAQTGLEFFLPVSQMVGKCWQQAALSCRTFPDVIFSLAHQLLSVPF